MTLEVHVLAHKCIATKSCLNAAPHTFALDATRVAYVTDAAGDDVGAIRAAAEACPTAIITVVKDGVHIG